MFDDINGCLLSRLDWTNTRKLPRALAHFQTYRQQNEKQKAGRTDRKIAKAVIYAKMKYKATLNLYVSGQYMRLPSFRRNYWPGIEFMLGKMP